MTSKRQFLLWVVLAVAATALLVGVLYWGHRSMPARWASLWVGDPEKGADLFFEKKDCGQCHPVNGYGGKGAPDLGYSRTSNSSMSELVTAMWNCAPRMWELIRRERKRFPALNEREMANVFSFLYTVRYMDQSGDSVRGHKLVRTKGCISCHSVGGTGGERGPDLSKIPGVDTPILWAQAMWNHAPVMEERMQTAGIEWPSFEGREMNDLLSYIQSRSPGLREERRLFPASADRGWKLFQEKSCIACHSVSGKGGQLGPELGPHRPVVMTVTQFAGLMWNHSPKMWDALEQEKIPRPAFNGQQMADLVAFLASLRYFEPTGSVEIGETVFAEKACSRCHGAGAEGDQLGPALRGRGKTYSTIALATALWSHGPKMYQKTQELKIPWPELAQSDVGNLIRFLNSEPEGQP